MKNDCVSAAFLLYLARRARNAKKVINLKKTRRFLLILTVVVLLSVLSSGLADLRPVETTKYNKVVQIVWTDENGETTEGPDGYAIVQYSYPQGFRTERYFDKDMNPYRMPDGSYGISKSTDGKGHVTEIVYLDEDGKKALNDFGYARVKMDYTSFGEMRSLRYYGTGKNCVTVPAYGFARMEVDFSGKSMTRREYQDENGKPVDTVYGYAVITQKLNKKYQVMRTAYEHADGTPATCEDGWSTCERERDDKGRLISVKYYDESGRLTDRGADYAYEMTEYTGENEKRVTRYDRNGQKAVTEDGIATWKLELKDDQVIRESFLNESGERILNGNGVGAVRYDYDPQGRIQEVIYENLSGERTLSSEGYAGYRDKLDENGRTESRTYLGTDGKAVTLMGGYSEIRYVYDEFGQATETYFTADGTQVTP